MTYPWTTGEVLTAADLNAYAGLVLVSSTTIGSAVSSVAVSSAFSSTFQNYRIVIFVEQASSSAAGLRLQFGSSTSAYYGSLYYDLYTGGTTATVRTNNGANLDIGLLEASHSTSTSFDVGSPNGATRSHIHGTYYGRGFAGWFGGFEANTTAFTGFTILPSTGTLTGGSIRVYGYNNG